MFIWIILLSLFTTTLQYTLEIIQKPSQNFDERIDKQKKQVITKPTHIILHYTNDCFHKKSHRALSNLFRRVSSHYLIAADGIIYQLVDESKRAWHAGKSSWRSNKQLNTYSIGIEIVNPGYSKTKKPHCKINQDIWNDKTAIRLPGSPFYWYPYTPEQIESVKQLCSDIMQRYNIIPKFILGHSDIAPGRKVDPGPLLPWQELAKHGIGVWHNESETYQSDQKLPTIKKIQQMLQQWGYDIQLTGKLDSKTKKIIKAFQMHFRPNNIDGILDVETVSILQSLLENS